MSPCTAPRTAARTWSAIAATVLVFGWTCAGTSAPVPSRILQVITDPYARFRISFPLDWQVVTTKKGRASVIGFGPTRAGQVRPNVNVVVEDLAASMSVSQYATAAKTKMAGVFPAFTIIQEGTATVARRPAYYRYYTWLRKRTFLEQVQTYFVVGRRAFVLTGTTLDAPDRVRRDTPLLAQIFETFIPLTK